MGQAEVSIASGVIPTIEPVYVFISAYVVLWF